MMYRIHARTYLANLAAPRRWQSAGLYDIGAATAALHHMRGWVPDDVRGIDLWLVPA